MNPQAWVALLSALVANAIAFAAVMIRIGSVTQRIDLLWAWYLAEHGIDPAVGRRMLTPRRQTARERRDDPPHDSDHRRRGDRD